MLNFGRKNGGRQMERSENKVADDVEVNELARRAKEGDVDAQNALIAKFLPRIKRLTSQNCKKYGGQFDEHFGVVMQAFIECLKTFNPGMSQYVTHATNWSNWYLHGERNKAFAGGIKYPTTLKSITMRVRNLLENTDMPEDQLVSWVLSHADTSRQRAQEVVNIARTGMVSLHQGRNPGSEGDDITLQDSIADEGPSPEESVILVDEELRYREAINTAVAVLTNRERYILLARFKTPPLTLNELAKALGVSRERVRQIQDRAKEKVASELTKLNFSF